MSRAVEAKLARLFAHAEHHGRCVVPADEATREALRRRCVEDGPLVRPARGIYARASYWAAQSQPERSLHLMRTLQGSHPSWVFCGPSAAAAFSLQLSYAHLAPLHVATSSLSWASPTSLVCHHRVDLSTEMVVSRRGLRVTSLSRTAFDCLRWLSFDDALVVADSILHVRPGRKSALEEYFASQAGVCHGVARAQRVLACADGRAESGGESLMRAAIMRHGFMLPQLQVVIPNPLEPTHPFRVDFLWVLLDGTIIVGELDGRAKYFDSALARGETPDQVLVRERLRESLITLYGLPVMRVSFDEVVAEAPLVKKLRLFGVPTAGSPLVPAVPIVPEWNRLLRERGVAARVRR